MSGIKWTPELRAELKRQVDAAPPLSDEQKVTLRALFALVRRPARRAA